MPSAPAAPSTTTQVRLWATLLGGQLPFAQAASTLELLTGVRLSMSTLERITVGAGVSLAQAEWRAAEEHQAGKLPVDRAVRPRRLYVGMDGLMTPLRQPWSRDGSQGRLECRYGECKVGVVYETDQDEHGRDARVRTHGYTATLESVETFGPLIGTLAHRYGHHTAQEVVAIGDGALWIWLLVALRFPGAVEIVDFYHACEHLAELADAWFGKETEASRRWQKERQADLKADGVEQVMAQIQAWKPRSQDKRDLKRTTYAYFERNAERMRYQTFLQKGYHIGSGVVEATAKYVVAQRVDQAGMHWRQPTAEAVVALRAAMRSTAQPDLRAHCRGLQMAA